LNSESTQRATNSADVSISGLNPSADRRRGLGGQRSFESKQEPAEPRSEITFRELWQIVSRRKIVFVVCIVAGLILSLAYSLVSPVRYEALGRLTVDFDSSKSLGS
jgi:hypothetical protein